MAGISKAQQAENMELFAEGLKRCTVCKEIKEHKEFSKHKATWDGLRSNCRICDNNRAAARYKDNREQVLVQVRKYREANREQVLERQREYYAANRDKVCKRRRKYDRTKSAADPLCKRVNRGAYRARKAGCEVIPFTSKDLLAYWEVNSISLQNCYYCNSELQAWWHLDHKIPMSKGGPHSLENLVPACARCNMFKQSKTVEEFSTYISEEFAASISDVN